MNKLVSIIIPAYNSERWIRQTIESALSQSYQNIEVIVVDDGSTDNTASIVKKYESKQLKLIQCKNGGVSSARNHGFNMSQGDYIQWLDSDDLLDGEKIKSQVAVLENESWDTTATGMFGAFYFRTEKAIFRETAIWSDLDPIEWLILRYSKNLWMQAGSWLISRELCDKAGPWHENLTLDEDGEYFCRVVSLSKVIRFVKGAKCYYRRGNVNSLCWNRSNEALESLLSSMKLSFQYLLNMENSERTRRACVKFMESRIMDYCPDDPEFFKKVEIIAKRIGGTLSDPEVDRKLLILKKMIGWKRAIYFRNFYSKSKIYVSRRLDELLYNLS